MSAADKLSLEEVMGAARRAVLAEADAHGATPDFFESVQRARLIAPDVVSEDQLEHARELAEVLPIRRVVPDPGPADAELASFLGDVVAQRDAVAERRRLESIPAVPAVAEPKRGRGRGRLVAFAAAAAVALMAVGVSAMVGLAGQSSAPEQVEQAAHDEKGGQTTGTATHRAPVEEKTTVAPEPEPMVEPEPAIEPEPVVEPKPTPQKARPRGPADDVLEQLDAEAQARWRAGDLAGAEAKFRELIRRAKKRSWIELAYGDLFALARQAHGAEQEQRLWREYLRKYPRGRHADDARAGLCRRAPAGQKRDACWNDYLADFPKGAHRKDAAGSSQ